VRLPPDLHGLGTVIACARGGAPYPIYRLKKPAGTPRRCHQVVPCVRNDRSEEQRSAALDDIVLRPGHPFVCGLPTRCGYLAPRNATCG